MFSFSCCFFFDKIHNITRTWKQSFSKNKTDKLSRHCTCTFKSQLLLSKQFACCDLNCVIFPLSSWTGICAHYACRYEFETFAYINFWDINAAVSQINELSHIRFTCCCWCRIQVTSCRCSVWNLATAYRFFAIILFETYVMESTIHVTCCTLT